MFPRNLMRRHIRKRTGGFSLVELVIVAAIMVSIAALAAPSMFDVIGGAKLRSNMGDLSALFQYARSRAVKYNHVMSVSFEVKAGATRAYAKDPSTTSESESSKDNTEIWLSSEFSRVASPSGAGAPPTLDSPTMWGTESTIATGDLSFNSRGIPCSYSTTTGKCVTGSSFVYYFSYNSTMGGTRWGAVGVSPAGRVRAFYWNGVNWGS